eukprot:CAMPEP_0201492032 /NCGR_PEP_ID=MMETSP0151_2-20130828/32032_1 /ASSEMBLY_ACC=CAM_ASM_000257 /TAXON_ID=200890 /ORGANISM="Paramoeba atlantica, Strain 621/1 / CCAP 1560/9" /LENGTH=288 /DNA_ID=CAMNT_0047878681 /DNA_START=199 /DNA_END=1065 /DNA_ORIENTATION=+
MAKAEDKITSPPTKNNKSCDLLRLQRDPARESLPNDWTLWFDRYIGRGCTAQQYNDALKQICQLSSIHDFWSWFNNLPSARELDPTCTYHLMKDNIRPTWEDARNVEGGNFTAKFPIALTNTVWLYLCLAAVSGQLDQFFSEFGDHLCGVSIGMRKNEASLYIWNGKAMVFHQNFLLDFLEKIFPIPVICEQLQETGVYKVHSSLENFGNEKKLTKPTMGVWGQATKLPEIILKKESETKGRAASKKKKQKQRFEDDQQPPRPKTQPNRRRKKRAMCLFLPSERELHL